MEKLRIAQRITHLLSYIPTILLIGISGGVATMNAQEEDDIDLFLITKKNTLWMTRIAITVVLECLRIRRRPQNTQVKNRICVNMLVDEAQLMLPKEEQDLFGAYEVLLLRPLWDTQETYQQFLRANQWVQAFLPNWFHQLAINKQSPTMKTSSFLTKLGVIDSWCRRLQLWYMHSHHTIEVTDLGRVRFHPHDVRDTVMKRYQQREKNIS